MYRKPAKISALALIIFAASLSGCGSDSKDEVVGQIITDCQLSAHNALENTSLTETKMHFALGEYVEKCLKEGGLQPSNATQDNDSCSDTPESAEDGKGFIKPLQKCWKNPKSSKG